MGLQREVWQFADADVFVYPEESDPNVSGYGFVTTEDGTVVENFEVDKAPNDPGYVEPLFRYCYLDSGAIGGDQTVGSVEIPGVKRPVQFGSAFVYTMSIQHLYFDKDAEVRLADVFKPNQCLRFVFRTQNLVKRSSPIYHVLTRARVKNFRISGDGDETISIAVDISAEDFYLKGE